MARTRLDEAGGLSVADVIHANFSALPAAELARFEPTVAQDYPAKRGEELALSTPARRVPVVDGEAGCAASSR
jgi:hypothetical protein